MNKKEIMNDIDKKELFKFLTKPVWFPAIVLAQTSKRLAKWTLDCIKNGDASELGMGMSLFSAFSLLISVPLFLLLESTAVIAFMVAFLIITYLSVFYIRDYHKNNK